MDRHYTYKLQMKVPEHAHTSFIAGRLRAAAEQVERMSSVRAAHDMTCMDVTHGTDHREPETSAERRERVLGAGTHVG